MNKGIVISKINHTSLLKTAIYMNEYAWKAGRRDNMRSFGGKAEAKIARLANRRSYRFIELAQLVKGFSIKGLNVGEETGFCTL
ncbi:hypothetical protein ARC310_05215 [Pantoea ananatis]|nr:hypothetical protein ARC310_05215 [Pantoea ananatis]PZD69959.1 hypothetical protein ARC311_00980 [Pantoea ananatis]